jgi:hypothetical protein
LRADAKDPDIEFIKSYYGLTDDFPIDQLISNDGHLKKISFISKEVSDFLYTDVFRHELNLVSLGA